eukprot:CAMPEP_0183473132 /NCGR_PEP_ID=MMETSP0370-20130417/160749_1 /TAXON_ID=268820 /ORGANISM="Peridinium aciculiferum, Strain PAER-2" /LENGTH=47 /DNA_ID= /DNA_START= /DNA_END= /DNA_ORIENTATION=
MSASETGGGGSSTPLPCIWPFRNWPSYVPPSAVVNLPGPSGRSAAQP